MSRHSNPLTAVPHLFNADRRRKNRLRFRPQAELLEERTMLAITAGTWQAVATPAPDAQGAQTMMQLSDGSIMVLGGGGLGPSPNWYKLTPDSTGSYTAGTWTTIAPSNVARLYAPTAVLPNGDVLEMGGEYSGTSGGATFDNTGEIYDPVANTWAPIATFPQSDFGDDPMETLPNGSLLAGYIAGPQTYIYNPTTNAWSQTGTKLNNDRSDEETWVKLPDGSILSYDVFSSSNGGGVGHAQRYFPSTGQWVDAGNPPIMSDGADANSNGEGAQGDEMGPAFLLPDGRAFFLGANGVTAYYTPSTNSWTTGPSVPTEMVNGTQTQFALGDATGAMMPNGDILFAASPEVAFDTSGNENFNPPAKIFEFDPTTNTYLDVTPSNIDLTNMSSFTENMLVLPTGQIMMVDDTDKIDIYTPSGSPQPAWQPQITSITGNGTTTFVLTGTQLNGISEGADYGDDNEMATNFPLVQFTDAAGNVSYARSFNWSSTGVQTGTAVETVNFTLPATFAPGEYTIKVIGSGIASAPLVKNFGGPVAADDSGDTVIGVPVTIDVLANDTANLYPIDPSSVQIVTAPADGSVQVNPTNGAVTYTPNPTFVGNDSFQYTVSDIHGIVSNVATVKILVDQPPIAENDLANTQPGVPVTINVLANDFSVLNTIVPSTLAIVRQPLDGSVQIVNGQIVYTPLAGYIGGDSFQYTVKDDKNHVSNAGTVAIRIGDAVSLSGFAYVDTNGDGIEEAGEVGIPNVTVELTKVDGNYTFSTFALTDAHGAYHFVEGTNYVLPAGVYDIKEINPGFYVPGISTMGTPAAAGPNTTGEFDNIALAPDQQATGYDFGSKGLSAAFAAAFFNRRAFMASTGPNFNGLDLAAGGNWISFDTGVQGTLTALAQFNPALGSVSMALLDSNMQVVATSSVVGGQAELSFSGQSSSPYFLELTGTNPNVTLNTYSTGAPQIAPPPNPPATSFHNSVLPTDVNGDGVVSALDALIVINDINQGESGALSQLAGLGSSMVDVNDDGLISALDALTIVNQLNGSASAGAAAVAAAQVASSSPAAPVAADIGAALPATPVADAQTDTTSVAFALAVAQSAGQTAAAPAAGAANTSIAGGPPTSAAANSSASGSPSAAGSSSGGAARTAVRPANSSSQLANLIWTDEQAW